MTDKKQIKKKVGFLTNLKDVYNKEKSRKLTIKDWLLSTVFILILVFVFSGSSSDKKEVSQKSPEQIKIEEQFSKWDGSHKKLSEFVKKNLKDSDSFEHIETTYFKRLDKDGNFNNILTINMKYRAKNSFGGYIVEYIKADYNIDEDVIKIRDQQ